MRLNRASRQVCDGFAKPFPTKFEPDKVPNFNIRTHTSFSTLVIYDCSQPYGVSRLPMKHVEEIIW